MSHSKRVVMFSVVYCYDELRDETGHLEFDVEPEALTKWLASGVNCDPPQNPGDRRRMLARKLSQFTHNILQRDEWVDAEARYDFVVGEREKNKVVR